MQVQSGGAAAFPKFLKTEGGGYPGNAADGGNNSADAAIEWPLIFLYDETSQTDFVQSFDERCPLISLLEQMFPSDKGDRFVDWDEDQKYLVPKLVAFLEVYEGRQEKGGHEKGAFDKG